MKVDLGQCAVCGAKNSKYVEKCYKCGAALPWAPGYVAPKNPAPQKSPQSAPQPTPAPADSGAKTVVIPPADNAPNSAPAPTIAPVDDAPTIAEKSKRDVPVPAWALGVGGLGLVVLGMGLWALLSPKPAPVAPVVSPTPIAIAPAATAPALAPIAPDATAEPTVAPTAEATIAPVAEPTVAATAAPATGVAVEPEVGPGFDELYANLTTGTPQQQTLYWESVKGKKINWRGEFVSLGNAAAGPLIVNCKSAKGALKVTIELDAATPQTLPGYTAGQSVPFGGVLSSRGDGSVIMKEGRVG